MSRYIYPDDISTLNSGKVVLYLYNVSLVLVHRIQPCPALYLRVVTYKSTMKGRKETNMKKAK